VRVLRLLCSLRSTLVFRFEVEIATEAKILLQFEAKKGLFLLVLNLSEKENI
jgi:hypothetical protein